MARSSRRTARRFPLVPGSAARAASDKPAQNVTAIDVSERLAITDIFFIASAATERQVNAIVDGIEDELHKFDLRPVRREGRSGGRWVLLDYADIVVHVQHARGVVDADLAAQHAEDVQNLAHIGDFQLSASDPSVKSAELPTDPSAHELTDEPTDKN